LEESNYLATTLLDKAYRVTAGNREQPPKNRISYWVPRQPLIEQLLCPFLLF
jgi:hypothetical protein